MTHQLSSLLSSGYVPAKAPVNPPAEEGLMAAENSFDFTDSKLGDGAVANGESHLIFTDALKDIQRSRMNASSLEERLALNEYVKT